MASFRKSRLRRNQSSTLREIMISLLVIIVLTTSSILTSMMPLTSILPIPLLFVQAIEVQWTQNNNVSPEHQAAHNAPRSQKYWDENGIERPDYAKTDAEIAEERRQKNGGGGGGGGGGLRKWVGVAFLLAGFIVSAIIVYGSVTGDWDTINNSPFGAYINRLLDWLESIRAANGSVGSGQRLGSCTEGALSSTTPFGFGFGKKNGGSEVSAAEARNARLARFDDNMKAD